MEMMELEMVTLHEVAELEPLILKQLSRLEDGLTALDNQLGIGPQGRPDILAVDANRSLVIIELKSVSAGPDAVAQCIRYYEWCVRNLALVARPFPTVKPDSGVRIFLVAPGFEENTVTIYNYLSVDITLVKYIALQDLPTKRVGLLFETFQWQPVEGPGAAYRSISDIVSYCADERVRIALQRVITDLEGSGITVAPERGGKSHWLECSSNGTPVAYLQARRRVFNCQVLTDPTDEDSWTTHRIKTFEQWEADCRSAIFQRASGPADGSLMRFDSQVR